jgi:hypothetical protein
LATHRATNRRTPQTGSPSRCSRARLTAIPAAGESDATMPGPLHEYQRHTERGIDLAAVSYDLCCTGNSRFGRKEARVLRRKSPDGGHRPPPHCGAAQEREHAVCRIDARFRGEVNRKPFDFG